MILGALLIAVAWLMAIVLITCTRRALLDRMWSIAASLSTAVPVGVVTISLTSKLWISLLTAATGGTAVAILLLHGGPHYD